jgi:hypothetical protein
MLYKTAHNLVMRKMLMRACIDEDNRCQNFTDCGNCDGCGFYKC